MSGVEPTDWSALPEPVRTELASRGYDRRWFEAREPEVGLTVRNLYVKLAAAGLWFHVESEWETEVGNLQVFVRDLPLLERELRARRFTRVVKRSGEWRWRERGARASLHVKHFHDWKPHQVQFHIDPWGAWTQPAWWPTVVVPLALLTAHWIDGKGYRDVARVRRLLLRAGHDPAVLAPPESRSDLL